MLDLCFLYVTSFLGLFADDVVQGACMCLSDCAFPGSVAKGSSVEVFCVTYLQQYLSGFSFSNLIALRWYLRYKLHLQVARVVFYL